MQVSFSGYGARDKFVQSICAPGLRRNASDKTELRLLVLHFQTPKVNRIVVSDRHQMALWHHTPCQCHHRI